MKLPIVLPSREYLQECFSYNEETGILTWNVRPRSHFKWDYAWKRFNARCPGTDASIPLYRNKEHTEKICLRVKVQHGGKKIFPSVHRVIYAMKGIEIPMGCYPDHKNGDPFDNRWENLRIATPSQNCCNRKTNKGKKSGLPKGVSTHRDGFRAHCMVNGNPVVLYGFKTIESAQAAYAKLAGDMHGEFKKTA